MDPVIGVDLADHKSERELATHQSYLDINVIDEEFVLQEQNHA